MRLHKEKLTLALATRISKRIGILLDEKPELTMTGLAKIFDISRNGLWILRRKYPFLEKAILAAVDKCNDHVLPRRIRQKFASRLLDGDAGSSEYIFYMMNKFPEEFKDKRFIANLHGTPDDKDFRDKFFGVTKEQPDA